jgi:hypothetical protein
MAEFVNQDFVAQATVHSAQDALDENEKKTTLYSVEVKTDQNIQWEITKRYSDFFEIHMFFHSPEFHAPSLKDVIHQFDFPTKEFPWKTFDPEVVEKRRSSFDQYLNLLTTLQPQLNKTVMEFCNPDPQIKGEIYARREGLIKKVQAAYRGVRTRNGKCFADFKKRILMVQKRIRGFNARKRFLKMQEQIRAEQGREERILSSADTLGSVRKASTMFLESENYFSVVLMSAAGLPISDIVGSIDAFVKLVVGEETVDSRYVRDTRSPVWNQLFCFDKARSNALAFPGISFEVYDHNDILSDVYVGKVEVPWAQLLTEDIYTLPIRGGSCPDHVDGPVRGFLTFQGIQARVSIKGGFKQGMVMHKQEFYHLHVFDGEKEYVVPSMIAVGERVMKLVSPGVFCHGAVVTQQDDHSWDVLFDDGGQENMPNYSLLKKVEDYFEPHEMFVTVAVFSGHGLKAMDWTMSSDPFVRITVGDQVLETKFVYQDLSPHWDQLFFFTLHDPNILENTDGITLEVFDYDIAKQNDLIGSNKIKWNEISNSEIELPVQREGANNGFLRLQVLKYHITKPGFEQGEVMSKHHFIQLHKIHHLHSSSHPH